MERDARSLSTADLADTSRDGRDDGADELDSREAEAGRTADAAGETPLLADDQASRFRGEWESIQTGFVDQPRQAVERADALVADLMQRLAEGFADERRELESQWDRGDDVDTEELRLALQRYRSFFGRLLNA